MLKIKGQKTVEALLQPRGIQPLMVQLCKIYFLFLVILSFFFILLTYSGFERSVSLLEKQEKEQIKLLEYTLVRELHILVSDLHVLADSRPLEIYLEKQDEFSREAVERRFAVFMTDRGMYDQIRYIDNTGLEVIRVNQSESGVQVVDKNSLQDKHTRYYFQETIQLDQHQIYLSPLDLNIENKRIESPLKPMLRIAKPLFTASGTQSGILILNYRAKAMLDRFDTTQPDDESSSHFLLNKNGYWLSSSESGVEWGFMLDHGRSFATEHVEVWKKMQNDDSGTVKHRDGLFLYQRIVPKVEVNPVFGKEHPKSLDNSWIIVSHIPAGELSYMGYVVKMRVFWISYFILAVSLFVRSFFIARAKERKKVSEKLIKLLTQGTEQSPAAVLITDKEGKILYINPKFEKLSGFKLEEVVGENPRVLKSGTTDEAVYHHLWQTITKGEIWQGDFENKNKEGVSYYVSAAISPMVDDNGHIEHYLAIQEDTTEKIKLQNELKKMALHDNLTGVANRGHFLRTCEKENKRRTRYGATLCLLVFDLDNFKKINDTYGHPGGDQVLKDFSACILEHLRESDCFGRLGGEEFAALLVETEIDEAAVIAERLRQSIEQLIVDHDGQNIQCTVSIGCTQWKDYTISVDTVLGRADEALYRAKEQGRNRVEVI